GGIDVLARYARLFGYGAPVGIELAYPEKAGLVPTREWKRRQFAGRPAWEGMWYPAETMDASIGQGFVRATPLQVAAAYAAIATEGWIYKPRVWSEVLGPDQEVIKRNPPQILRRVPLSPETWETLRTALRMVTTDPRGTARGVFDGFPIPVAGKTGTAEAPSGSSHAWFASYAPADHPEIVVVVFVDHGGSGAGIAAPVAREVLEAYFQDRLSAGGGPSGK
ncbi:MAG TPA: penicillin-binding transpeptidase domain-containing protein, partial [Limnochordia bacterium]